MKFDQPAALNQSAALDLPVEFRLLGDLQVRAGGEPVELGTMKQRLVLAALLLDAGHIVPAETLIDRVWGEDPPAEARAALYTYVARIRRALAGVPDATLLRRPGGYLIHIDPLRVDLHRLRRLAAEAGAGDERLPRLRAAVELWRDEPLAGLTGDWAARVREGLRQQLLGTMTEWAEAELTDGRADAVANRLAPLVDRYPLAEQMVGAHLRALSRQGRRAEALDQFARTRQRIVAELGVEPGPELREVHRVLLGDDAQPAAPRPSAPPSPGCQLPAALTDHTGADAQLTRGLAVLGGPAAGARPVLVVAGPGGVGKTALAVRLAHALHESYPDGQLFVSLDGARGQLADVLNRVLHALRVPEITTLRTVEDKLARYRLELSGRRILLVFDSAAGAEDVRPLMPGDPGCALIVTSRVRLTTVPGAEHVELRTLTAEESMTLLRRIIGDARADAEPEAAAELTGMCGGLPLALRIVGARLAARPHWRISRLVQRMSDERRRLDEMAIDGLAVRVSVAISHDGLSPAARRLFGLLGHAGPPDFAGWLAATLLDEDPEVAEELLEQLVDARLVEVADDVSGGTPRYRMHALVRLYAGEQKPDDDLPTALTRAAAAATELADRLSERLPIAVPRLFRPASHPTGRAGPIEPEPGWLATESAALVSLVERAAELDLSEVACALADALVFASFAVTNNFTGWDRAHGAALRSAERTGNVAAMAVLRCGLALLRYKEDRFAEAERQFALAVELFDQAGNAHGTAIARNGLGTVLREVGRHREAVPLLRQALGTLTGLGDDNGAGHAAYCLGHSHRELGEDDPAIAHLERALELYSTAGHWRGEVVAMRGIGLVHRARGDLDEAMVWCRRAHDRVLLGDDPLLAGYTLQAVAKVWIRAGEPERAREPLEQVLRTCRRHRDRFGVALARRTIGEMHLAARRFGTALFELQSARELWRELEHELGEARTLRDMGAAHAAAGDCPAAHLAWDQAAAVFHRLGTREEAELPQWRRRWGCFCSSTPCKESSRSA